ncbi:MAG: diguanylate cyclase [Thermodesulfobacteriota bacterium]|nr:diguanylate cyclase [Thermodesulfobacteriota bacterium]
MALTSILIVDPEESHRDFLTKALNSQGFTVKTASGAAEALVSLDHDVPDLVILDEIVKGLTPDDLLNKIQERDLDSFTVIISNDPDLDRGMGWLISGAFAYLAKPVRLESLRPVIEKGLENKEAYHQILTMAQELQAANRDLEQEKAALNEKSEQLRFLYELGSKLSATLKPDEITDLVAQALSQAMGADLVVFLTDFAAESDLRLYSNHGLETGLAQSLSKELYSYLAPGRADKGRLLFNEEANENKPALSRPPDQRLVLPLIVAGKRCGVLGIFFHEIPHDDLDRMILLESVALQSAQALLSAHQHEIALNQAARDPLTALFNRRVFDEYLCREFNRSQRYKTDLSLIMMDLDHFKSVNDRFGHNIGDDVIHAVAQVITESVRTTDIPSRIGGEEFAVILPDTKLNMALMLAERIRENVSRIPFDFGSPKHEQTISQGVADTKSPLVRTAEDLIILADQAMYLSKEQGRNTVRSATDLNMVETTRGNRYACK